MTSRRVVYAMVALSMLAASCTSEEGKGPARAAPAVFVNRNDPVLPLSRAHEGPALVVDKDDPNILYLAESEMVTATPRRRTSAPSCSRARTAPSTTYSRRTPPTATAAAA